MMHYYQKVFLIKGFILCAFLGLFSQTSLNQVGLNNLSTLGPGQAGVSGFIFGNVSTLGSPILFNDSFSGTLRLKTKAGRSPKLAMQVNILEQKVWVQFQGNLGGTFDFAEIRSIKAYLSDKDSTTLIFRPIDQVERNKNRQIGCYQVLNQGYPRLLKRVHKRFIKATANNSYDIHKSSHEYQEVLNYILESAPQKFEKIKLKDRSILAKFGKKAAALKEKYQLSFREEKDVVLLLQYLSQEN